MRKLICILIILLMPVLAYATPIHGPFIAKPQTSPPDPVEGMFAYANSTDWNPGDGEGLYVYENAAWEPLFLVNNPTIASTLTLTGALDANSTVAINGTTVQTGQLQVIGELKLGGATPTQLFTDTTAGHDDYRMQAESDVFTISNMDVSGSTENETWEFQWDGDFAVTDGNLLSIGLNPILKLQDTTASQDHYWINVNANTMAIQNRDAGGTTTQEIWEFQGDGDFRVNDGDAIVSNGAADNGSLILLEDSDNGTNSITIDVPDAITASKIIVLPEIAGTFTIMAAENTFGAADTSPSVSAGNIFATLATPSVTIADLDDGTAGQIVIIRATDAAANAADANNLNLVGAWAADSAEDTLMLYTPDGTKWIELSRSDVN